MAKSKSGTDGSLSDQKGVFATIVEVLSFIVLLVPYIFQAFIQKIWPPKSKSLDGLVVLVTDAGRGLGQELALSFAHHGAAVACVDADREAALVTAADIVRDGERARAYQADVSCPGQVAELRAAVAADLGPVDILVLSCGADQEVLGHRVGDVSDSAVRAVTDSYLAHVWMVREFLPEMKHRGEGHIVSVTSMASQSALAGAALYTAACAAVNGFIESVRLEVMLEGFEDVHFTVVNAAVMDSSLSKSYSLNAMQRLGTRLTDQVAAWTVAAVRRNLVHVHIPPQLYLLFILAKILPTPVVDWAFQLFSIRPKLTNKTA